jgi:uncharacterized membrane protein
MIEWLTSLNIPKELVVVIISILPIFELRGALPVGINLLQIPWYSALFWAVIGNMVPVPILLLFLDYFVRLISKIRLGEKLAHWVLERTRARSQVIQKYERIGLIIFVAIPLPFTGAWTGAIAAFLLGMKFTHAFLAILCGVVIAGIIVTCLCFLGWVGAAIAGVVFCALVIFGGLKI